MMDEKLLLKCENTVFADEVVSLLAAHGIASRLHDENRDTVVGAYGAVTGIAVYVFKKDYETATALVTPVIQARNNFRPMCPKCGSEEVETIVRSARSAMVVSLLGLILIFLPIAYVCQPEAFHLRSGVADLMAFGAFLLGCILLAIGRHSYDNFKCRTCGKTFHH